MHDLDFDLRCSFSLLKNISIQCSLLILLEQTDFDDFVDEGHGTIIERRRRLHHVSIRYKNVSGVFGMTSKKKRKTKNIPSHHCNDAAFELSR